VTREDVWRDAADDLGEFGTGPYDWRLEETDEGASAVLTRRAPVGDGQVTVERRIQLDPARRGPAHTTRVTWDGPGTLRAVLAEQWSLGLFGSLEQVWAAGDGTRVSLWEPANLARTSTVRAGETYSGLTLTFALRRPADVWSLPIFTISNSESGYERNHQGVSLVLRWEIALTAGIPWAQTTDAVVA
jgi:4-alpha-glucanotransferase